MLGKRPGRGLSGLQWGRSGMSWGQAVPLGGETMALCGTLPAPTPTGSLVWHKGHTVRLGPPAGGGGVEWGLRKSY